MIEVNGVYRFITLNDIAGFLAIGSIVGIPLLVVLAIVGLITKLYKKDKAAGIATAATTGGIAMILLFLSPLIIFIYVLMQFK